VVWSTKYRKRALRHPHEREECKKVLRRAAEEYGMGIAALEVDVDHVHVSLEVPPQRSVGRAVGILKSLSARHMFFRYPYLRKMLWAGELWEASYFVRTIGDGVTAALVQEYIESHERRALEPAQEELFPKGKAKPSK
jgi:putative transposase